MGALSFTSPTWMFTFRVITWQDKGRELALLPATGLFSPTPPAGHCQAQHMPPKGPGAWEDTHPLVIANRELHCELGLGLEEKETGRQS